ncbi:MAG: hypothetical protein R2789_18255 [Microthrixaceae bacterium]
MLLTIVIAAVICFAAGVAIGLPALRIKGLYLALVTLAVAVLFPALVEQFSSLTGGGRGLALVVPQEGCPRAAPNVPCVGSLPSVGWRTTSGATSWPWPSRWWPSCWWRTS